MALDRAPEDILHEEQENTGPDYEAEQAQQEFEHLRDAERDRQMVTEEPKPPGRIPIERFRQGRPITLGLPHLSEEAYGLKGILNYSYWNANGSGIVILAIEGGAADWAAYIGSDDGMSEEECIRWTAEKGCKLSRAQAHRWFPQLPIEAYRE